MTLQIESAKEEERAVELERGPKRLAGGDILAMGFGITAGVWMVAYVCRLPFLQLPGQWTIGGMVLAVLVGGVLAARYSGKGIWCAVWAGALSGLLDILIAGSLMEDYVKSHHETGGAVPAAALWVMGSIVLNTVVATVGGAVGALAPSARRRLPVGEGIYWTNVFAIILVCLTLMLIGAGGLVTAFHAGLAVPDWPTSYQYNMFLFPLSLMQQDSGRFYEHAHRLIASLVGFTSLALAIHITVGDRRGWVKGLAWAIGFGVLIQAILGGTRVTETSVTLAIAHGVFAQVVFGGMAVLAASTSGAFWKMAAEERTDAGADRWLSVLLVLALVVQLMLGARLRHRDEGLLLHISMAAAVLFLVLACGSRAWGLHGSRRPLKRAGLALIAIVGIQIVLGILALVFWTGNAKNAPLTSAILTTLHQMNGAMLLASSGVYMAWVWRLLRPAAGQ